MKYCSKGANKASIETLVLECNARCSINCNIWGPPQYKGRIGIGFFYHQYETVSRPSCIYNGNGYTEKDCLYIETDPRLHWKSAIPFNHNISIEYSQHPLFLTGNAILRTLNFAIIFNKFFKKKYFIIVYFENYLVTRIMVKVAVE